MYLKNLTLLGFKSFADKTSLVFQPGVSAIVGPNGCGKSNIGEAIRWVLGEQSAKVLRADEMSDVIFSGTDARKPLAMAEVTLTLADVDKEHLVAAGVELDYNEISITRRVFRDGVSEYFINRTPCRLKDIQQLFMGTGLGRSSYAILNQGHVTQVISSKPEDRRAVFEEAAGITKYKAQRREALRKLEYTEQNMLRIADLVREVKRQLGSLQRQAGKARRYKQLNQELRHLETQLARHEFDVLQGQIADQQARAEQLAAEIRAGSETVVLTEADLAKLREQLFALEHQISQAQQHDLELKAEIEQHQNSIQFNQERISELDTQHGRALSEIAQAQERRNAAQAELVIIEQRITASETAISQHTETVQVKQAALRRIESEIQRKEQELRDVQAAAFAVAQELSRVHNQLSALEAQKQANALQLQKLSAEKRALQQEHAELQTRVTQFTARLQAEQLDAQTRKSTIEQKQRRLVEVQHQLDQLTRRRDELLRQQAEMRSRLELLEQLQAQYEGYSAGAQTALKRTDSVLGALADKIRVPDEYVTAIETALGHYLQAVLTDEPAIAQRVLAELHQEKKGRVSIAALALKPAPNAQSSVAEISHSADPVHKVVPAMSVIEADAVVRPLLAGLLGRTLIVPDLQTATSCWLNGHLGFDFVTIGGDMLSRHGIYTGGANNGNGESPDAASILRRKNQIAALHAALDMLQNQLGHLHSGTEALRTEQATLQAELESAMADLRKAELDIATRQSQLAELQNAIRSLEQRIETVDFELQTSTHHEKEAIEHHAVLLAQTGQLEQNQQACQSNLSALTAALDALRQARDAAHATLTESKVALAAEEQVCAALRQQHAALQQRLSELDQLAQQRQLDIASAVERRAQALAQIEQARQLAESLANHRLQVQSQIAELIGQRQACAGDTAKREERLRQTRTSLDQLQQQRANIEVELAQKQMATQNLRERIKQKYNLNLDDVPTECITITIAVEGPAQVHVLTPEEMTASGLATDWYAVAEHIAALQKRIEEMGPVNPMALDEFEETQQRYEFLSKQYDDLVQAKNQLLDLINRINAQTRQMFAETFEKIRQNFRVLFAEVFGGGRADLYLLDEADPLESGIEIVARPPGKQLQSIALLSGGEQTMTAVALLFAIYQVRPSPFCVLDELDAPLDEPNINRFIRILLRFVPQSQFIIITHNKRTIGMADTLYGVTMEEQGLSKIVTVKFHKAHGTVPGQQPAQSAPLQHTEPIESDEDTLVQRDETLEFVPAK